MINNGKRFEMNFKNSVPDDIFFYRFKDGTASWGQSENVRFQASNMCDCMIYKMPVLIFAELKNHKGKSLPFTAIRENQMLEMMKAQTHPGIKSMLIVNFEDVQECYGLDIFAVQKYIDMDIRKSIPVDYFREFGINIPCQKKKVNTGYDLSVLFQ